MLKRLRLLKRSRIMWCLIGLLLLTPATVSQVQAQQTARAPAQEQSLVQDTQAEALNR